MSEFQFGDTLPQAFQALRFFRTEGRSCNRLEPAEVVSTLDFPLQRSLYVAEGKGWVSIAGPAQQMLDKPETVSLFDEPLLVKLPLAIVRYVAERHGQPVVKLFGEQTLLEV